MADSQKKDGDGVPSPSPGDAAANGAAAPAVAGTPGAAPSDGSPERGGEKAPLSAPDAAQGSAEPAGDQAGAEDQGKDTKEKTEPTKDQLASMDAAKKSAADAAARKRKAAWKKLAKKEAEEGDDDGPPPEPQESLVRRCLRPCLPKKRTQGHRLGSQLGVAFENVYRPFEISVSIRALQNVLSDDIDAFFRVKIASVNPRTHKNKTEGKLLPVYTGAMLLHGAESFQPDSPLPLWVRNFVALSYSELKKHQLEVDMWKVSKCSFNTLHGVGVQNLFKIANGDPHVSVFVKKAISPAEKQKKKGSKTAGQIYDVALFSVDVQLEEIFDFRLKFENFSLEPNVEHGDYKTWLKTKKCLSFVVPKNASSDPQNGWRCNNKSSEWASVLADQGGFIWKDPLMLVFSGTRTQLTTSCFLVNVYSQSSAGMGAQIGKALLGLTSILEFSVFKGIVKCLNTVEKEFNIGKLNGNVRYTLRSKGIGEYVDQLPLGCPIQPAEASISHLKRREKHLVVSINKCDGLPVADPDFGWSDPYLRVSWDNMVKTSWVSPGTTRPVFNVTFYFPVRLFSPKLESKRYRDTALQYEIQSKGALKIMVWDADPTSAELLGSVSLSMYDILSQATKEDRTLKGRIKKDDEEDQNEFAVARKLQWFDEPEKVRVYDGGKSVGGTELRGSSLKTTTKPLIFFEAYFYPDDWPMFDWNSHKASKENAERWLAKGKEFLKENRDHQKVYKQAFPESIGAYPVTHDSLASRGMNSRRFPCTAENPTLDWVALPSFLVKIITPEEYSRAPFLLHWISCFTFHMDSRQSRQGYVERWNDPQMVLFARQGSPQDHAILLCSILLGTKRDAYVVKGMVYQQDSEMFEGKGGKEKKKKDSDGPPKLTLKEHVWVMTRESNDWITFWEPCTRELYHLKDRYKENLAKKKKKKQDEKALAKVEEDGTVKAEDNDDNAQDEEEFWEAEVKDKKLEGDEIEQLPTIGRTPKAKVKVGKKEESAAEKMKAQLMAQREKLAIAPLRRLLDPETSLVDWLPYDSIEIVFNNVNVWANHQNHHPACITYDFDDAGWCKLLKNDQEMQEYKIEYISPEVVMDPVLDTSLIAKMEHQVISEMQENMRLNRRNRGLDSIFDLSKEMRDYCEKFLIIHEMFRRVDYDMCPLWSTPEEKWTPEMQYTFKLLKEQRPYNKLGSPWKSDMLYASQQSAGWEDIFRRIREFLAMKTEFPSKRGKDFDGFPVHFSTGDRDHMRKYLMELPGYKAILEDEAGDTTFVVHCKMFGLLNMIPSVWLYFGQHRPSKKSLMT